MIIFYKDVLIFQRTSLFSEKKNHTKIRGRKGIWITYSVGKSALNMVTQMKGIVSLSG